MTDISRILSDNLKRLRKRKGWTQADLAEASGLSLPAVQGYEGRRRWPEKPYVEALAHALGCSPELLFISEAGLSDPSPSQSALAATVATLQEEIDELKARLKVSQTPYPLPFDLAQKLVEKVPEDVLEALVSKRHSWSIVRPALGLSRTPSRSDRKTHRS